MRSHLFAWMIIFALCLGTGAAWSEGVRVQKIPRGLYVSPQGVLMKGGAPYRGIGVNYCSVTDRVLGNPANTSYRQGFKVLAEHGIPFARIRTGGFWPFEFKLYLKDKEAYFRIMDDVVKSAENNHVGLICSLFWFHATVPDMMGEPINQWGNPKSKTRALMRQYIKDMVTRYKDSDTIWGWECGNEWSETGDLPKGTGWEPFVAPKYGTPNKRTDRDILTTRMILSAYVEFGREVRKIDPDRIILSGNTVPRNSSWHNSFENTWTPDTFSQYAEIVLRDNPDPFNVISIHLYPLYENQYFADRKVSLGELLAETQRIGALVNKPLILGEFGAQSSLGKKLEREKILQYFKDIEDHEVPLAAIWDFDGVSDDPEWLKDWSITADNERGYMLDLIAEANQRIQKKMKNPQAALPKIK